MIGLIYFYKCLPLKSHNYCNFTPTCSTYAITAFEKFGFFKGTYLTIKRLIRCNGFHNLQYDPVPEGEIK